MEEFLKQNRNVTLYWDGNKAWLPGNMLFLVPRISGATLARSFRVRFQLPSDWKVFTPWPTLSPSRTAFGSMGKFMFNGNVLFGDFTQSPNFIRG